LASVCLVPDIYHKEIENEYLTLQRNYKYIVLNGDFSGTTANEPDFIFIEETHGSASGLNFIERDIGECTSE
jgi:hypothetical protein